MKFASLVISISGIMVLNSWCGTTNSEEVVVQLLETQKNELRLEIKNASDQMLTLKCNIADIDQKQFMDFPETAEFEFRNSGGQIIRDANTHESWFSPSLLNSVINQPVFSESGQDQSKIDVNLMKLEEATLGPKDTMVKKFSSAKVLSLLRLQPRYKHAFEFRVRLPLTIVVDGVLFKRIPESNWSRID